MGIWDVETLKKEITLEQVRKWMAFYRVDPWGSDWRRAARMAVVSANAFGAKVDVDAEEKFLPTYRQPEQTEEQMIAELKKIPGFRQQLEANGF
jgi:hypothetical protein